MISLIKVFRFETEDIIVFLLFPIIKGNQFLTLNYSVEFNYFFFYRWLPVVITLDFYCILNIVTSGIDLSLIISSRSLFWREYGVAAVQDSKENFRIHVYKLSYTLKAWLKDKAYSLSSNFVIYLKSPTWYFVGIRPCKG